MRLAFAPYKLIFKQPAITSRSVMTEKLTYFIKIWDERNTDVFGIGEAALFKGLSCDDRADYEIKLVETLANVAIGRPTDLSAFPSIQFGLEQAILDFSNGCQGIYYPSEFTAGNKEILINGLVWMGDIEQMLKRIDEKIEEGFRCIKLKIGALNFADELLMLKKIRNRYSPQDIEIRVDANGGFTMDNVLPALEAMRPFHIHSIEQPIKAGQHELMKFISQISPIPVALDEELIGINNSADKISVLDTIQPHYIILKPSLTGGFSGAREWIDLAESRNIGWWITSALESNVGLSALAQWAATLGNQAYQGLGTGNLYVNNFDSQVYSKGEHLLFDGAKLPQDRSQFNTLDWRI